ncbi:hypothetical protein [Bacillus pumilus]|uniref:hypothetical protein n=1 Tax=Bacillus pumilus TaxID=1408 RepID=UPI00119DFC7D|nr:hypothetical protein [Bacillus pumilus]
MSKIVKGDWVEALVEDNRRIFHISGYVLVVSEDEILLRFLSGNSLVVPKSWVQKLDVKLTEGDLKDKHLFKMFVRDLKAIQGK